jgi:hypothetical protein
MPQTYAQTHAQTRHHAGKNPREHGAPPKPLHEDDAVESGNAPSNADDATSTQEGGLASGTKPDPDSLVGNDGGIGEPQAPKKRTGSDSTGRTPGEPDEVRDETGQDRRHPEPAEHNDNEKSTLPERDDAGRKQAPNDRPGHKSGEGETPVG